MKKTIVMTIVFVMVLLSFANIVSAKTTDVTISGGKKVTTGEAVTVTVTTGEKVEGAHFIVKYDKNFLEFDSEKCSALGANDDGNGTVELEFVGTAKSTFEVPFKVVGKEGSGKVTAEPTMFTTGDKAEDQLEVSAISGTATFEIEENKIEPSNNTVVPKNDVKDPVSNNTVSAPAPTSNETAPAKYPKTGFNFAPIAISGLVLGFVALAVKYRKISK